MALIRCPQCGKRMSSYADRCPQCGYEMADFSKDNYKDEKTYTDYYVNHPHIGQDGLSNGLPNNQNNETEINDLGIHNPKKTHKSKLNHRQIAWLIVIAAVPLIAFLSMKAIMFYGANSQAIKIPVLKSTPATSVLNTASIQQSANPVPAPTYVATAKSSGRKVSDDDLKYALISYAMKKVKNHLLSPSTAKFSSYSECGIQEGTDNVYSIVGYVDATNAFNAVTRTTWSAMIQYDGTYSSVIMIQVGDDMYFD